MDAVRAGEAAIKAPSREECGSARAPFTADQVEGAATTSGSQPSHPALPKASCLLPLSCAWLRVLACSAASAAVNRLAPEAACGAPVPALRCCMPATLPPALQPPSGVPATPLLAGPPPLPDTKASSWGDAPALRQCSSMACHRGLVAF